MHAAHDVTRALGYYQDSQHPQKNKEPPETRKQNGRCQKIRVDK